MKNLINGWKKINKTSKYHLLLACFDKSMAITLYTNLLALIFAETIFIINNIPNKTINFQLNIVNFNIDKTKQITIIAIVINTKSLVIKYSLFDTSIIFSPLYLE